MGKILRRVKIFDTANSPNGITFNSGDAQTMASDTNAAMTKGHRIPIGLGHTADDTQPAYGKIIPGSLSAGGTAVYADLELTDEGRQLCASGAYTAMSIELLRGASIDGTEYRMVIDRLALLGSAQPAVRTLDDLQKLAASRHAISAQAFSTAFSMPDDDGPTREQFVALTAERDRLKKQADAADAALIAFRRRIDTEEFTRRANQYVLERRVTPAMRDMIAKKRKDAATPQTFSALDMLDSMAMAPGTFGFAPGLEVGRVRQPGGADLDNPVPELAAATREYAKQNNVDVFTAMGAVARTRKDLVEPVMTEFQRFRESHGFRR
jgi:hypothetical protein